ncbi:MAG: Translation elongation factor Ts, partial [uncultured bacterium]
DMEKAVEILRKKGEAKAADRADRSTGEGVIAIAEGNGKAAIIKLGCETDFVAKGEDFVKAAQDFAEKVLSEGEDFDTSGLASELSLKSGEKIEAAEKKVVEGGVIGTYIHSNNKIGVIVTMSGGDAETARDIAMHAAAMNPKYLNPEDVPQEEVDKEKEIWKEELKGKPENIMGSIMAGKEKKFREENALIAQTFVKDPEKTVERFAGENKITSFVRLAV